MRTDWFRAAERAFQLQFILLALFSCEKKISSKSDLRINHLKGSVKRVTNFYFYGLNPFTKDEIPDDPFPMETKDTIHPYETKTEMYDLEGNILEAVYTRNGFKSHWEEKIVYIYTNNKVVRKIVKLYSNNRIDSTNSLYKYDTSGLLTEIVTGRYKMTYNYYFIPNNFIKYKITEYHDSIVGGTISSMETFDSYGRIIAQDDFESNSDSTTESDFEMKNDKIVKTTTWEYFENYNIKTIRVNDEDSKVRFEVQNIGPNGEVSSIYKKEPIPIYLSESDSVLYSYGKSDAKGNWLRKTTIKNGITFLMKRKIEYY